MKNTSLCYLERGGQYLMLHRIKKEDDENKDKWIGVGGKFEPGESPEDCVCREVREETGLRLTDYRYCGIVTFVNGDWTEYMHLFHATGFEGQLRECDEGVLEWIDKKKLFDLQQWEGDKIFLRLMDLRGRCAHCRRFERRKDTINGTDFDQRLPSWRGLPL